MTQQLLPETPEKTQQHVEGCETGPASAPSFQGGLHPIAQLQRTLGNRRVAQLIQAKRLTPEGRIIGLQRKLTVGAADDQYEQEADRVASQVMNTPDAVAANSMQRALSPEEDKDKMLQTKPLAASITPFVQRQMVNNEEPEDKEKPVQAKFSTRTSKEPLQRQPETDEKEKEPIQTKSAGTQGATMSPEEDKDKMLQTKTLTAFMTPFMKRQMVNNEKSEDKEKPVQAKFVTGTSKGALPRQPEAEEEETGPIQAKSAGSMYDSFEAGDDVETQLNRSKGLGSPLPDAVRTYMEPRFGIDFSGVRVHTCSDAIQMNRDVGAQAFTHGSDIFFGEGHSPNNFELTAHELTHVVQQTGGAPLQTKKSNGTSSTNTNPSLQRICPACSRGKEEERKFDTNSSYELTHFVQQGITPLTDQGGNWRSVKQNPPMKISRTTRSDASWLMQRAVTNLAVAGAAGEAGQANDFVVARGAGPVIITATVAAPGQAVNWTGGNPRPGNNLERVITATSARTVTVTADTPADPGPQSITVHVVSGRNAPANTPAQLSFSRQPGIPPGFPHSPGEFGLTDVRVNDPVARIRAFLAGNQWAFQVDQISHRYQMAVASGNINIPTAASATSANHCQVITDMTPGGATVPPPNVTFWSRPIVEAHELAHVARFYSPPFWEAFMRIAEANIEAVAGNVNVDHTVPATLSDSGVVTANAPAHQAILDAQHAAADAAEIPGAEAFAHGQSNPMFTTLVAQIAARFRPLAPTALAAVALGPASVQLNWNHNACNETEYRVYRRRGTSAFAKIATLPAGTVAFNDTLAGLAGNTDFTYFVTAAGVAGESNKSNQVAVHTP